MRFIILTVLACLFLSAPAAGQYLETTIPVGERPWALCYNPVQNKVYCANYRSDMVTVISGETNEVIAEVPVGYLPRALVYNSVTGNVYCGNYGGPSVSVIDGRADTVIATIPVAGYGPRVLEYTPASNKVYCSSFSTSALTGIDAWVDTVTAIFPDLGSPYRMCWNSRQNKVYCAEYGDSDVRVIDVASDSIVATIRIGSNTTGLTYNPVANRVYCATYDEFFYVIDAETDTIVYVQDAELLWDGICVDTTRNLVHRSADTVYVHDGTSGEVVGEYVGGEWVSLMYHNTLTDKIYCVDERWDRVNIVDAGNYETVAVIDVGEHPYSMTWNPAQNRTYVASYEENTVTVIRDRVGAVEEAPQAEKPGHAGPTILCAPDLARIDGRVLDVQGRDVTEERRRLSPGVYFVRSEDSRETRRIVLTR